MKYIVLSNFFVVALEISLLQRSFALHIVAGHGGNEKRNDLAEVLRSFS